jgi:hypothetical protein
MMMTSCNLSHYAFGSAPQFFMTKGSKIMTVAKKKPAPKAKKPQKKKKAVRYLKKPCVTEYVEWTYVPEIGRGVIARKAAKKGTVLERSPVVVGPNKDFEAKHGRMTAADHYLLTWHEKGENKETAMGLGYLMLYNHSDNPNAEFRYRYPQKEIEMVALRAIKKGEEITHDYGGEGVWFRKRAEGDKKSARKKK